MMSDAEATLERLRRLLLALVAVGMIGSATELTLIAHNEDSKQVIPFIAIGITLVAIVWHLVTRSSGSAVAVQLALVGMIAVAALGVTLHYQANMEFQLEMDRSLSGTELMWKVLEAKAPPALAPGNLALLALFGLLAVYGGGRNGS